MKIVECVPNFSEGRDKGVLDQIVAEINSVEGSLVVDVDMGADTNRTVVTFFGSPDSVQESAFLAIKKAAELIDMSQHTGAHPRMGATDVCPFIPVSGVTMQDCVEISKKVGKRVGDELGIPIFLYEESATRPEWRNLAKVREGEYEALEKVFKLNLNTPKPISCNRHIVVMEYLRGKELAYIKQIDDPEYIFNEIIYQMRIIYQKAKIIHGDLGEFNIVISKEGDILIIDWIQCVSSEHPNANSLLHRDIENVCNFFLKKFNVESNVEEIIASFQED